MSDIEMSAADHAPTSEDVEITAAEAAEKRDVPKGEVEAVTPAKKLDLKAFVAGIKPVTRMVRLYGNGGARIDLDVIDRQIDEAKARRQQAQVNRLQKERITAAKTLNSERVMDLTIVGWTETRSNAFAEDLTAEGITEVLERNLRQVAAQTTHIDGTTLAEGGLEESDVYEMLMDLYEIPGMSAQISRLVRMVAETNADPGVVSVPL